MKCTIIIRLITASSHSHGTHNNGVTENSGIVAQFRYELHFWIDQKRIEQNIFIFYQLTLVQCYLCVTIVKQIICLYEAKHYTQNRKNIIIPYTPRCIDQGIKEQYPMNKPQYVDQDEWDGDEWCQTMAWTQDKQVGKCDEQIKQIHCIQFFVKTVAQKIFGVGSTYRQFVHMSR